MCPDFGLTFVTPRFSLIQLKAEPQELELEEAEEEHVDHANALDLSESEEEEELKLPWKLGYPLLSYLSPHFPNAHKDLA